MNKATEWFRRTVQSNLQKQAGVKNDLDPSVAFSLLLELWDGFGTMHPEVGQEIQRSLLADFYSSDAKTLLEFTPGWIVDEKHARMLDYTYGSRRQAASYPEGRSDYKPGKGRWGDPSPQLNPEMFSSEDIKAEIKYLMGISRQNEGTGRDPNMLVFQAYLKLMEVLQDRGFTGSRKTAVNVECPSCGHHFNTNDLDFDDNACPSCGASGPFTDFSNKSGSRKQAGSPRDIESGDEFQVGDAVIVHDMFGDMDGVISRGGYYKDTVYGNGPSKAWYVDFYGQERGPYRSGDLMKVSRKKTSRKTAGQPSDVCPDCGAHMDDVWVSDGRESDTIVLAAHCDNCGWVGYKKKPTASRKTAVKYPDIRVDLEEDHAFAMIGQVEKALRRAKVSWDEIEQFKEEALSGDYNHVIETCAEWVNIGGEADWVFPELFGFQSSRKTAEYLREIFRSSDYPSAEECEAAKRQRATELRRDGWKVKTKLWDFTDLARSFMYELEATREPTITGKKATRKTARAIYEIAADIKWEWGSKVNYAAKPYLDAMMYLDTINDRYGMDDARMIVAYFLSNASSFRGEKAKELKAELKALSSKSGKLAGGRFVTDEELDKLRSLLVPLDTPERRQRYLSGDFPRADAVKDLNKRYRWDVFHEVFTDGSWDWIRDIYDRGGNDSHADTALRQLIPVLSRKTASRIDQLRSIVENKQYAKVDGQAVDLFTASGMVQVYDALSPENQAKFETLPIVALMEFAWKMMNYPGKSGSRKTAISEFDELGRMFEHQFEDMKGKPTADTLPCPDHPGAEAEKGGTYASFPSSYTEYYCPEGHDFKVRVGTTREDMLTEGSRHKVTARKRGVDPLARKALNEQSGHAESDLDDVEVDDDNADEKTMFPWEIGKVAAVELNGYVDILVDGNLIGRGVVVNLLDGNTTRVATEADLHGYPVDFWTASTGERYVDVPKDSGSVTLEPSNFYTSGSRGLNVWAQNHRHAADMVEVTDDQAGESMFDEGWGEGGDYGHWNEEAGIVREQERGDDDTGMSKDDYLEMYSDPDYDDRYEGSKTAVNWKWVVLQRGTLTESAGPFDSEAEAQESADAINLEYNTNDHVVMEVNYSPPFEASRQAERFKVDWKNYDLIPLNDVEDLEDVIDIDVIDIDIDTAPTGPISWQQGQDWAAGVPGVEGSKTAGYYDVPEGWWIISEDEGVEAWVSDNGDEAVRERDALLEAGADARIEWRDSTYRPPAPEVIDQLVDRLTSSKTAEWYDEVDDDEGDSEDSDDGDAVEDDESTDKEVKDDDEDIEKDALRAFTRIVQANMNMEMR